MSYFVSVGDRRIRVPQGVVIALGSLELIRQEGLEDVVRLPLHDTKEAEDLFYQSTDLAWKVIDVLLNEFGGREVGLW